MVELTSDFIPEILRVWGIQCDNRKTKRKRHRSNKPKVPEIDVERSRLIEEHQDKMQRQKDLAKAYRT